MTEAAEAQASSWTRARPPAGWTVLDVAIAAVFLGLLVSEIVPNPEMTPHVPLLALSVVMTVPLAWRSSRPGWVAITVCVGLLVSSAVSTGPFAPQLAILPVLVALYSAASRTRGRAAFAVGAATLGLTVAAWLATAEGASDDFWPWMLWAGAWVSGTFVRRRGDVAARHAARAARLEIEAGTTALASAEAERDRIARELHDVVAHAVSVMVVQAGAERLRLGQDAGRTGKALESIEESGRTALAELRSMLGVMRDGSAESLAPIPGVAEIPDLVERLNSTGVPTALVCHPARPARARRSVGWRRRARGLPHRPGGADQRDPPRRIGSGSRLPDALGGRPDRRGAQRGAGLGLGLGRGGAWRTRPGRHEATR